MNVWFLEAISACSSFGQSRKLNLSPGILVVTTELRKSGTFPGPRVQQKEKYSVALVYLHLGLISPYTLTHEGMEI